MNSPLVTYTYWGPSFAHGGPQPSINIAVVHDVEAPIRVPRMGRGLLGPNYFGHGGDPGKPVSIHYLVSYDDISQGTDENTIAWHVGNGNSGTIGLEQCGYAAMSEAEWLAAPEQLANMARLMADISARHPLIRLRWLTDAELIYAWHNKTTPGGWTTHRQMTRCGLGSDHTDPGTGWPADHVMSLAQGGIIVPPVHPPTGDDDMALIVKRVGTPESGHDYAWTPDYSLFIDILSEGAYNLMHDNGTIGPDHGKAECVEQNLIDWTHDVVRDVTHGKIVSVS